MADTEPANLDDFLGTPREPVWKRYVKWVVIAVVLIALAFLLSRCFGGSTAVSYATTEVKQGRLAVTVSATGNLAPTNKVDVGSELSGLVEKVFVDVNDRVGPGQPLAELDPSRLDDAITRSQAALAAQQAAVQQNVATVAESRAQLDRLREVSRLSGGRVPAKTELEQAQAAFARAIAGQRAAEANVVSARAQLRSDETQRFKAVIRSPVAGVVLARQIEPGQTVASSFNTPTLFVIAEDLTQMKLEVAIDEADVGQVKEGQSATFNVDAYPGRSFPARITRVDVGSNTSAQSSTSTSAASTASTVVAYDATLAVANSELVLRPGMTATAEIAVEEKRNVLLVPNSALRFSPERAARSAARSAGQNSVVKSITPQPRRGGGGRGGGQRAEQETTIGAGSRQTVYVLGDDGNPKPVSVTTGSTDGRNTEVKSRDLKPGMKVITGQRAATSG